jgi:hypothetical protein
MNGIIPRKIWLSATCAAAKMLESMNSKQTMAEVLAAVV